MNRKISDLKGISERVLTVLNLYELVNIQDFAAVLKNNDVSNNIRQLKYRGYINLKKDEGLKLLSITEKGLKRLETMPNDMHHIYSMDMPLEDRAYNRKLYQRHVRGQLAFIEGGVNATKYNSIEMGEKESVYLDIYQIKKEIGEEIKGSTATGLLLTPEESYVVYCSEGGFVKVESTEKLLKTRLKNILLPQSKSRSELKDIVICPSIKDINGLLFNRAQVNKQLSNYIARETDRNKYLMTMEYPEVQATLLTNKKFRDEILNTMLFNSLRDTLPGLKRISNREFTDYENGKVVNLLDLNLGLIKKAKNYAMEGQLITLIILSEYKEFFEEYFSNSDVVFIDISKEQIMNLYKDTKEE
jgi:DNA-binding MarR family transcriptional regulator